MKTKILIAVPTFENILPDTFRSIYRLQVPEDCVCQFDYVRGYDCARARNLIAKAAIEGEYTHVLMVDSDMQLPEDTLVKMLKDPKLICLGCYPRKNTANGTFEIFKLGQKDFIETYSYDEIVKSQGKIEVKGGGFGCAMINTDVFKNMPQPFFRYVEYESGDVLSEDNYFCSNASKVGFKVYADTDIMCGHSVRGFQWR